MEVFKEEQNLDKYVDMFEHIYEPIQNIERDFNQVLARLLESIAACSQSVNKHNQKGLADNLPKVFSWYCSLVSKSKIDIKLSKAIWRKFPKCCPYCLKSPCRCASGRKSLTDNGDKLEEIAKEKSQNQPQTLYEWQEMFANIYPRDPQGYDQKSNFSHLIEELGEASEAYRIRYFSPTALESELADIFTWILGMANLLNAHARDGMVSGYERYDLGEQVFKKYPGKCKKCGHIPCSCVSDYGRQKISELNVIYPEDIMKAMESLKLEIKDEVKTIFRQPEAQGFMMEIKKSLNGVEITELRVKALVDRLILEPSHKKWYENITASGMAESAIVSTITALIQSTFK